jgi:UDPglucose--hexose-1-phosphate uridylyltransferase
VIELRERPHTRWNPLAKRWVLVSPHRTQRPWQGHTETIPAFAGERYDPACYLCPGNARANGASNPAYAGTHVFDNDFAALRPTDPPFQYEDGLLRAAGERGLSRVLIYSPDHSLTMSRMTQPEALAVIALWRAQFAEIERIDWVRSIMIFENRGAMMGASNPHPHGQLWANESVPDEIAIEAVSQAEYFEAHAETLLSRYVAQELRARERIVIENDHFAALVPFWAVWPFETMIVPKRAYGAIADQTPEEDAALAAALRDLTARYDNVFDTPFPYSMGLHQRPVNDSAQPGWHFHMHFYPPLLRSATVRKFLVGYELMAWPQRDITPEAAAKHLREVRGITG